MSALLIVTLALLGMIGGFSAGLLGFGGGVLMFPLLYYVPPLLGLAALDAQTVAATVVTQVFFSTLVGGSAHLRAGRVHRKIAIVSGSASAAAAFVGGMASAWVSERFLILLFAGLITVVLGMMMLPAPSAIEEDIPAGHVSVPLMRLVLLSSITGLMIGFLGAGNFVFVPLLIYTMKVPTRLAIGSSLFIAMTNTFFGFLGKAITGQIPLLLATVVVLGAAAGAWAGEQVHSKLSTRTIRYTYASLIAAIGASIWITILAG
jgi:uncharacterized membrane protein YfcA